MFALLARVDVLSSDERLDDGVALCTFRTDSVLGTTIQYNGRQV